jgi:Sec-independent protein translocase protein TatA
VLLIVWIVVAVLALGVLGVLGYSLLGAAGRLRRELRGLERDVRPLLADAQATAARAAAQRSDQQSDRPATAG